MVVSLLRSLLDHTALLQEVVHNGGTADVLLAVELHLHELTEAGRIVVPHGLGISCVIFFFFGEKSVSCP